MRDTLFISHATPQDNEFAIWLASRLEMLGYKTWIDKKKLLGGERFWPTIQKAIENSTKVLLVYSKKIVTNEGVLKEGIENEIEYAKSIASQYKLHDYIIPLHIDNSPYNLAIGLPNINQIHFQNNWADGLKQLLTKLEKDNVPKTTEIQESTFSEWYENDYISKCSILNKHELFYTSWWQIAYMPQNFFLYQFETEKQAKEILTINKNIIISKQANIISTFEENLNYIITKENETFEVLPTKIYSIPVSDILNGFCSDTFPQHREAENYFKQLIKNVIFQLFKNKGLFHTTLSNKKFAYYLPVYKNLNPIKFQYPFSSTNDKFKRKSICGDFEKIGKWHFAVSLQPIIFPFVGFSLKSHLVFTSDGFEVISDSQKSHTYRRRKGKRFFNEEWRDMMLAFIQRLKDEDGEIKILVSSKEEKLIMKEWPEMFWSEIGYDDPNSKMDIDKIENYIENNEEDEIV